MSCRSGAPIASAAGRRSRRKGATGERELAEFLTAAGFPACRGQQYRGGADSPDVRCPSLPLHFESKRTETLSAYPALEQATVDAGPGRVPVVAHRRNGREWLAILRLDDLLKLFQPETSQP